MMSERSSSTWKMRSPEATARWYCPIHMPIIRSGQISRREVEVVGDEAAEREAVIDHEQPADEDDHGEGELREEIEQRAVAGLDARRVELALEHALGALGEARGLGVLLREGLDDAHADDRLLGLRRDVGDALLDVAQHGMRAARVARGDDRDRRQQDERDQRELPARDDEQRSGGDQRGAVLRDEDEPVAEEHAHGADVARRAREQLAGLVLVVEAERHPLQVRVERLAQVVLDVQREAARDQAPRDHEGAARGARGDDQPDPEPQARAVVRPDRPVDGAAGEARDREREGLRGEREHDRPHEQRADAPRRSRAGGGRCWEVVGAMGTQSEDRTAGSPRRLEGKRIGKLPAFRAYRPGLDNARASVHYCATRARGARGTWCRTRAGGRIYERRRRRHHQTR